MLACFSVSSGTWGRQVCQGENMRTWQWLDGHNPSVLCVSQLRVRASNLGENGANGGVGASGAYGILHPYYSK